MFVVNIFQKITQFWQKLRSFKYFGHGFCINDVDGKPKGIVWLVICTSLGNYRIIPMGYQK